MLLEIESYACLGKLCTTSTPLAPQGIIFRHNNITLNAFSNFIVAKLHIVCLKYKVISLSKSLSAHSTDILLLLQIVLGHIMPAERKKSASMEEKESLLNNKEKDCSERRPVSNKEKPKDDLKIPAKKEVSKVPEDKKKKLEEDKRKKEDKERKKKEEEKVKAEEELKKKEEEEKKKHEEEERKKQEEQAKRQQEEAAAQLK